MSQIIWNIQNHIVIKVAITIQIGCSSMVIQLGDDGTSVKHSTENKNHTPKYQYCIDRICLYQFRKNVIEFTWYNIVFWSSIKVAYDRNAIYLFTDCKLFINIYHWSRLMAICPMIEAADNHFSFPATMFGFFMDGNVINRRKMEGLPFIKTRLLAYTYDKIVGKKPVCHWLPLRMASSNNTLNTKASNSHIQDNNPSAIHVLKKSVTSTTFDNFISVVEIDIS